MAGQPQDTGSAILWALGAFTIGLIAILVVLIWVV